MKLLKIKKIWNEIKLQHFTKGKKIEQDEINWDKEFIPDSGWQQPSMDNPAEYWKVEYLANKARLDAILDAIKRENKELYICGTYKHGYWAKLKNKSNEITESK